ncbi:MAG TPA: putative PEP-binding protein, partial [Candidatus Acidoferrum sp.]|nr:putative PEP-binding protein [Candidatus Acidoferrum sp.]
MSQAHESSTQLLFACPLASGMHARPASLLAEVANGFSAACSITNSRNNRTANGKSVLGIISADIRHLDRCSLQLSGSDAQSAHAALRQFVEVVLPTCDVPNAPAAPRPAHSVLPRMLRSNGATFISGIPISAGIGQGKIVSINKVSLPARFDHSRKGSVELELERITSAIGEVRHRIQDKLKYSVTAVGAAILKADIAIAGDVLFLEKLKERVLLGRSAPQAVVEAADYFLDLLGHSENEYIRQRALDLEEICQQLLEELCGLVPVARIELTNPSVLVTDSLAPQQLLDIDLHWLKGLILAESGSTSHAAILARSLGIPALAGIHHSLFALTSGQEVIVDANRGFVVPLSSTEIRHFYTLEDQIFERRKRLRSRHGSAIARTADGRKVEIGANVSSGEELRVAFENGADGIGLFRTEMIYLGRENPPSEDEQFAIYSEAVRHADGRPIIIRTFDIGGDKKLPYLNLPDEENPFLGYRGIRLYAEHRDLLQSQLRAILRASVSGNIRIMAPMVASLEELLQFKKEVARARQNLSQNGTAFKN